MQDACSAHYQLFYQTICIIIIVTIIIIFTQLSLLAGGTNMGDKSGNVLPHSFVTIYFTVILHAARFTCFSVSIGAIPFLYKIR